MSWQQSQRRQTVRREGKRYRERIPRSFSGGETLRRGYCYSARVWIDFRVRVSGQE